ncbi:hypothetical protein [Planomonospora sp. ID82291]|uniref:hypothetical protein n=1 Tax=Planomonospora sp. ID82291 TaxID=2738136 RepID=UPI0018C3EE7B|nr:hypothetical protein [Planomonospora sp. ID82291]MBG0818367.1 hypothetical protein [Planomonospora sp. ID82291]
MSAPSPSSLPGRSLAVGDTVLIRGLERSRVDSRHSTWLIGRTGRVSALLAAGGHAEITIDVTSLPAAARRRTTWTLHTGDLERTASLAAAPRTEPRPGDRVTVAQLLLSHSDTCAHHSLVGQSGVIAAVHRDGTHALVRMDEEIYLPGAGPVHRLVFHLGDLKILCAPCAPRPSGRHGTGLDSGRLRHAVALTGEVRRRPVPAVCGTTATPVVIGDWTVPFEPDLERTCPACAATAAAVPRDGELAGTAA